MSYYKCRKCESRFKRSDLPAKFHDEFGVVCAKCFLLITEKSDSELKKLQAKYHKELIR